MSKVKPSPREFLKSRRPERFSDSVAESRSSLDRALLEYHLDTITSRSEELLFEEFARQLASRTICPNLLPHTGPSGGGDSKVDSENYPVAAQLELGWYIGSGTNANTERWGFAFSAKKKWRPKLESDVAKIVGTGREYKSVFFISNQFIRDKARAEMEDALRKNNKVDVRILDRSWILDTVFERQLENLAIQTLHIQILSRREVRKGPLDTAREKDLQKLENIVQEKLRTGHHNPLLVEDCLTTAVLARSLERPRFEVDGLHQRALRVAKEYGTPHQQVECVYQWAWTTFWWYEDYPRFLELYADLEKCAIESDFPDDIDSLANLFSCLFVAVSQKHLDQGKADLQDHADVLFKALDRIISYQERPSAALEAKTRKLTAELLLAQKRARPRILKELTEVVHKADGLVGYAFEPFSQIVAELGVLFGDLTEYQELFEAVVSATSIRKGEVAAARMLLARGAQQLNADDPYEAIRTLGRTMGKLFKYESRSDAVRAMFLCSHAYERVGLHWAARGTVLAAAALATSDFLTKEEVTPQQAACYNRIKWLELRLGRIPHILAWHELDMVAHAILAERGFAVADWRSREEAFDPILGILMLRLDLWQLRTLQQLPDLLEKLQLPAASIALIYSLGHENEVPKELTGGGGADSLLELFLTWRDQPAAHEVTQRPELYTTQFVELESFVAGCRIAVDTQTSMPCVELAESLLACTEALLATMTVDHAIAREPEIRVKIRLSDFSEELFAFDAKDDAGRPRIDIRCRAFNPHDLSVQDQMHLKKRLFDVVGEITARILAMGDPQSLLTKLFRDDLASQRAIDFTTSFAVVGNVLGKEPRTSLASWKQEDAKRYDLRRESRWDAGYEQPPPESRKAAPSPASPDSKLPAELALSGVGHHQLRTVSLIREALWNKAGWSGVAFATCEHPSVLPVMGLIFENPEVGVDIFRGWLTELGETDEKSQLRVAIVRKISKANPSWYRVVLGSEPASFLQEASTTHFATIARIHTMTPNSSENLDRFLRDFESKRAFQLMAARLDRGEMNLAVHLAIRKNGLVIRDAWEVGPHELESIAVFDDDDLVIPSNVQRPPSAAIAKRRSMR